MRGASILVVLAALAVGCGETPDAGYLLVKERIISAVPRVEGDPDRATPRPGETVTLEWGLASPAELPPNTWAFIACPPSEQEFGIPVCGAAPFVIDSSLTPSSESPLVTIEVPADYEPEEIIVIGAVCVGGVVNASLDPSGMSEDFSACQGEGFGQVAVVTVHVEQSPEQTNRNPGIAQVTFGGTELTEEVPIARQPCRGSGLPEIPLDEEVELTITAAEGSREAFFDEVFEEETLEELAIELFISRDSLNKRFTVIDDDTPQGEAEYIGEEDPDDPVPAEGQTVQLLMVMRDQRGGQAEVRRGFCLVP